MSIVNFLYVVEIANVFKYSYIQKVVLRLQYSAMGPFLNQLGLWDERYRPTPVDTNSLKLFPSLTKNTCDVHGA